MVGLDRVHRVVSVDSGQGEPTAVVSAVAAALAGLYLLLVPLQLVMLPRTAGLVLAVFAVASAMFFGVVALVVRRAAPGTVSRWVVAAMGAVPIVDGSVRLGVTGDLRQTTWLMLAIVGVAAFVSSRCVVAVLIGSAVIVWLAAVAGEHPDATDIGHFGLQLGLAIMVAVAIHTVRIRREIGLRTAREEVDEQLRSLSGAHEALAESEQRYRTVFAASPVGISLSDEHGHFVAVNEALCRLLARPESDVLGRSAAEFTHPADLAKQARIGELIGASADGIVRFEKRYLRPDGQARWGWLTLTHTPGPLGQTWTLAHMQDSTERKLAEQALIDSEANLTAVARVMHRIQSGTDAREAIVEAGVEVSDAGYVCLLEPCPDRRALRVTASSDPSLADIGIPLTAASATVQAFRTGEAMFLSDLEDHPLISPALLALTGARSIYLAPVSAQGSVTGVLMVGWRHRVADLDDRRARAVTLLTAEAGVALRQASLLAELEQLAKSDPLTGLLNRRGWDDHLAQLVTQARRTGTPLTIALADLDHFKRFNDTFGHPAGDRLLKDFARGGRAALRTVDTMARWGGEEFAIALPECSTEHAAPVLDRVRQAVTDQQTCSIGYATWDGLETVDELLDRVDSALYVAKHGGRNRVCPAPPATGRHEPTLARPGP